jgi:UDP-N-acetylglucosamine--N-acetylmuramyl-(pentapeptide) pyrophosphoryl-undecaprenol N-acetylglucosamine transferase
LCIVQKPAILVPSPNVAEDHQTHNAMSLVKREAALLVRDAEAGEKLVPALIELINDEAGQKKLAQHIALLARPDAADHIAKIVLELAKNEKP